MKPVCAKCGLGLMVEKVGVYVVEMFQHPPKPYKVWTGDILVCPTCDAKIVYGFSDNPVAVHHEEDFDEKVARIKQGEYIEVFERGSYRYDKKVLQ